ncbi:MAG TPA: hypothetical protein PKZ24_08520, partial [Nitrospirales bacterium]|nr:hypothetical protein [Nitrospirales bacterium]
METPFWADGRWGSAGTVTLAPGKCPAQESGGGTGSGSGSDEGITGKKVVSPRARRQAARAACARGLSQRRAAWLCTTPRSGIRYEPTGPHRDRWLAQALRGVAKRYPQWGYRLAGSFLRHRGWRGNVKRLYRVWGQCGLQGSRRKPRKKVVTGTTLQPWATHKNEVWSWDFVHDATTRGAA